MKIGLKTWGTELSAALANPLRISLFVVLALAFPVHARADFIGLYGDTLHTDCDIDNPGLLIFWVEVFHYSAHGASGCQFSAPYQPCLVEAEFHSDIKEFAATSGDSQTGVAVDYGDCLSGWIHVLTIVYVDPVGFGGPDCCVLPVLPDPNSSSGEIEVTDCDGAVSTADALPGIVNSTEACPCGVPTGIADPSTTWGRLKALFAGDE